MSAPDGLPQVQRSLTALKMRVPIQAVETTPHPPFSYLHHHCLNGDYSIIDPMEYWERKSAIYTRPRCELWTSSSSGTSPGLFGDGSPSLPREKPADYSRFLLAVFTGREAEQYIYQLESWDPHGPPGERLSAEKGRPLSPHKVSWSNCHNLGFHEDKQHAAHVGK